MKLTRKQFAQIGAACAVVAILAVFLPWYTSSGVGRSESANGFGKGPDGSAYKGVWVLLLTLVAGVSAALVAAGRTSAAPVKMQERQWLFVAACGFALAAILTLTDVLRSDPPGSELARQMGFSFGKSFGIWFALLGTLAGAVASFLATTKPDTQTAAPTA